MEQVPEQDVGCEGEETGSVSSLEEMHYEAIYELGLSHHDIFQRYGVLQYIDTAIDYLSRALESTPKDHPHLSDWYANLGVAYTDRFRRLGKLDDLDKAIEYDSRALALTPDSHPDFLDRHAALGVSYSDRFRRLGQLGDLEKAIEYDSRALALTPEGDSDILVRLAALGVSYNDRYRRLGQLEDLEKAIEHHSRALSLTADDHPDVSERNAALGGAYINRFRRLGNIDDLEKAIARHSRALTLTPEGHSDLSSLHANLGAAYSNRFQRLGKLEDLERSVAHKFCALESTPNDHPDLPGRYASLGVAYTDRYQRLGELDDLEKAIEHDSRALTLTPNDHPSLPSRHGALGVSYMDRYKRLERPNDLEKSIVHRSRALALAPDGHPDISRWHADLGSSYREQFQRSGQVDDLEKSVEHRLYALALTPEDHPDLARRYTDLGVSYADRFQHLGESDDLEKAVEHHSRALPLTPEGHPRLPTRYLNQARAFFQQFQHTGLPSHLSRSLDSFHAASRTMAGAPAVRFRNALEWADVASKHSPLHCIEAYQTAIDLLPQFIWLGTTIHQRYYDIASAANLATSAASAAIRHANQELALEWLEHARCVLWNQSLMLRSPIEQLRLLHPAFAARLQAVAEQLHDVSSDPLTSGAPGPDSFDSEQIGNSRRRLATEYGQLLEEARAFPGFEDFLKPSKAAELVRAARNGPIVVINCHKDGCDALLILPGNNNIQHLTLPNFTHENAKRARSNLEIVLRHKGLRERGVRLKPQLGQKDNIASFLLTLWSDVVKPVLDFLGYLNNVSAGSLPHITWCPTGALSFLPLHAAGDYDQPGSRVFDYVVSSYAPTLTALLAATPSSLSCASQVLAIGQEHTPGRSPLPGTTKELANLEAHTQAKTGYTHLKGNQATVANVIDAMEKHDWVHLACHAHQNVSDPTKSGFFLHDGTLDLATINRRSFKNKGLAFLSACQTATGDERLPDEAIHLASGMLMAGYPSVIATMWSVIDSDAPFVADKVYGQLMKDGKVANGEAGKALHDAVAALREKVGEKEFARWVPYIHIGS